MAEILYKCHAKLKDEYGNLEINYKQYNVIGETKEYYIIRLYGTKNKKVQKDSKNGFAFDSKDKALFNFLKRRERYTGILAHFQEQNHLLIEHTRQLINSPTELKEG